MRVLILAEAEVGSLGGGESVIHGLVRGLASLDRGQDEYNILCPPSMAATLKPLLREGMTTLSRPPTKISAGEQARRLLGPLRRPLGKLLRRILGRAEQGLPEKPPALDDFIRSQPFDVLHFMVPLHYASGAPRSVFTVHDLQHEHLPDIFDDDQIRFRRTLYEELKQDCQAVVAISAFTAGDFQKHHPCPQEKLFTVPWASYVEDSLQEHALSEEETKLLRSLPTDFILYPAYSYRHKNHRRLLEALSLVEKTHGLRIPLVCTGGRSPEWQAILQHARQLHPVPDLKDLGYTSLPMLHALYRQARFVVFPTLFEGAGLPLLEAARLGRPIACSDIPPFREFGGEGPAYFDPTSAEAMAATLHDFWHHAALRMESARRVSQHSQDLTWERCARSYQAIYRQVAGMVLSLEDQQRLHSLRSHS